MPRRLRIAALALAALTVFAACSDDDDGTVAAGDDTEESGTTGTPDPNQACYDAIAPSDDLDAKPPITIGDCAPPSELVTIDVVEGDGDPAAAGSTVTAHYVGVGWDSKQEFDSSWSRGEPSTFSLAQVIAGWQQGIPGMQVGGRRVLIIPGALAYGASPPPGSGIAADETLVFVVDLTAIA